MEADKRKNESKLTQGLLKDFLLYDPETGLFTRKITTSPKAKKGRIAGSNHSEGYIELRVLSERHYAHRLAWLYVHGEWPEETIDHINRNRKDNRICNLRKATKAENNQNKSIQSNNKTGQRGVYFQKQSGKYTAQITVKRKTKYLGQFSNIEDAIEARLNAESEMRCLNERTGFFEMRSYSIPENTRSESDGESA